MGDKKFILVVVSQCRSFNKKTKAARMHFDGVFDRKKIKGIRATFPDNWDFVYPNKGREYIMHLHPTKIEGTVMYGEATRLRDLDEVLEKF